MRRLVSVMALTGFVMLQVGCAPPPSTMPSGLAPAGDILEALAGAIPGLTYQQGAIGAGSLLGLAEAHMPSDAFDDIMDGVPGAGTLLSHVRAAGLPDAGQLTSLVSLREVLDRAGITAAQQADLPSAFGALVAEHTGQDLGASFVNAIRR